MDLTDVSSLLGITIASAQEEIFEARLASAIDQAKEYCNRDFTNENNELEIPAGAKMGVALMVQAMGEKQNVQSQALGDMSKSFFEGGTYKSALNYLKPYRKARYK